MPPRKRHSKPTPSDDAEREAKARSEHLERYRAWERGIDKRLDNTADLTYWLRSRKGKDAD